LCKGSVNQWKRIKIGVYALSAGAKREKCKLARIFTYKFENWCYIGPTDFEFENDLKTLKALGYIQIIRERRAVDLTLHSTYILTEKGVEKAKIALNNLTSEELASIKKIAEDLMNEKDFDAIALYSKYASAWGRVEGKKAERIAKTILSTASSEELHELAEMTGDKTFLKQYAPNVKT
jgi:hypothetical protein